jgi:hypothetical protein
MTTYTTTAIATSSVDNTVTVASISNMIPGLPITFSGVTFGGITQGSTYYIGNIVYGYPTSKITLTSLPGGAVFALTTATGSMTAQWNSGGQQILVTTPPGENLNTAFTKINTNFDQLWAAGPVNSNIKISENTIYTLNTNGDLILNPNGIGNVVANAHVIPDTTLIRNLGSPTRVWNELYVNYLAVANLVPDGITIPVGNLHILGGNNQNFLQTDGDGNLSWANPVAAAGGNNTQVQYNVDGVLDGSNTFTFNSNTSTVTIQNVTTTGVANLNSVGNVQIAGGVPGYVLQTDGTGNLSWTAPTGNITSILDQQIFGDGSTVDFTLVTPSVTNAVIVSINGVMQIPDVAYSVASDIITFTEAPLGTDLVDIRFLVFGATPDNHPGGADGFIQFNLGGVFGGSANLRYSSVTGNLYSSNVSVSGNITAGSYFGDGSHLTGITAVANTGNVTFANSVISTNNANAALNILTPQQTPVSMAAGGNSATTQMLWATNIGALTPDQLNNGVVNGNTWGSQISAGNTGVTIASNSVVGLKTWTFGTSGTVSGTGGIIAGTVSSTGNVVATGNISATGNVAGNYILGNVAFATGIPQSYGNSNVYALLNGSAANIVPLANISYSLGNATNQWKDIWVSNSTIYMNSVPVSMTAGNVLTVAGNKVVTTNGDATGLGNIAFDGNNIYNINGAGEGILISSNKGGGLDGEIYLPFKEETANLTITNYGANINLVIQGSHEWQFDTTGNLTLPSGGMIGDTYNDNANAAGLAAGPAGYAIINSYDRAQYVQADDSNVYIGTSWGDANWSWSFDPTGNITLPSNVANINYANGVSILDGIGGGSGYGNAEVAEYLPTYTGNLANLGGDVNTSGNVSASGNVTAGGGAYFIGDGSLLTGITATANTGNVTFNNSTIVGPSFGVVPSANSSVYIQPTVDSATRYQFSTSNLTAPGNISATGNITAGNFVGNGASVTLVASSSKYIFDNGGTLTLPAPPTGNEGSEIDFTKAGNSTLSGNVVVIDQYVDRFRFFEAGGNARGAYIDLTQAAAGVGTLLNNRVSGLVNAGTFVTMDNLKATVTTSGNRGLSLAAVSGSFTALIGATYAVSGGTGGSSTNGSGTINTTPSTSQFAWNFGGAGDISTYIITDTTNSRAYRVTLQIGFGYLNNMISIERLV